MTGNSAPRIESSSTGEDMPNNRKAKIGSWRIPRISSRKTYGKMMMPKIPPLTSLPIWEKTYRNSLAQRPNADNLDKHHAEIANARVKSNPWPNRAGMEPIRRRGPSPASSSPPSRLFAFVGSTSRLEMTYRSAGQAAAPEQSAAYVPL